MKNREKTQIYWEKEEVKLTAPPPPSDSCGCDCIITSLLTEVMSFSMLLLNRGSTLSWLMYCAIGLSESCTVHASGDVTYHYAYHQDFPSSLVTNTMDLVYLVFHMNGTLAQSYKRIYYLRPAIALETPESMS